MFTNLERLIAAADTIEATVTSVDSQMGALADRLSAAAAQAVALTGVAPAPAADTAQSLAVHGGGDATEALQPE